MAANSANLPVVMLVEDEPMIALALEEEFIEAMFLVSGPFRTCADALSALETELPDVAVLDAILEDGPCHDLALELKRRGVPFLICSGMPLGETEPAALADVPRLTKPSPFPDIVRHARDLLKK
jgi:DNA-binding response OmpR family regulator